MTDTNEGEKQGRRFLQINSSINERNFIETPPIYATVPNVTFDGFNYHVVFLTTAPSPAQPGQEVEKMGVAARLVLPPLTVEATINALIEGLTNPQPVGLFKDIFVEGGQDE